MSVRSRDLRANSPAGSRMEPKRELTDEQWQSISDLFPHTFRTGCAGRPTIEPRICVEGIIWVLRTGARWKDLPSCFPSPTTCWRRFEQWTSEGIWEKAWGRLLRQLDRSGKLKLNESIADATFASAKKGVNALAKRNPAKARRRCCSPMVTDFHWALRSPRPAETTSV